MFMDNCININVSCDTKTCDHCQCTNVLVMISKNYGWIRLTNDIIYILKPILQPILEIIINIIKQLYRLYKFIYDVVDYVYDQFKQFVHYMNEWIITPIIN
eukprot:148559_1